MPKAVSTKDIEAEVIASRSVAGVLLARILTNQDGGMENRSSDTNRSLPGKVARPSTVLPVENWAWPFCFDGAVPSGASLRLVSEGGPRRAAPPSPSYPNSRK